ncbi:hypothetical protein [Haloglycomyces albus]|uniref:hypothetical protein n=1 Tax=Haloglycomyces albus TaxID=526067 RepID=UPI00046D1A31|nr:hypothetical protein [Haloglycomyces albus]
MTLPQAILRLTTGPLATLNNDPALSFAYATGAATRDDESDDAVLVCVWDLDTRPESESDRTIHYTLNEFQYHLDELEAGRGWEYPSSQSIQIMAAFAEGILLADDSGTGAQDRARAIELPELLAPNAIQRVKSDTDKVADELASQRDPFERTALLLDSCHRAYVALFAANGHWYPGPAQRTEYAHRHLLNEEVGVAERQVWKAAARADDGGDNDIAGAWRNFMETILD